MLINYIERVRDYTSLILSIISSYIYFTNGDFKNIIHGIGAYLTIDLFINKKFDIYMHHIIGLMLYSFIYSNNLSDESRNIIFRPFIAIEISSVFYNIECLYPKNNFVLNKILFLTTFFYYRIYRYYYDVLLNDKIYNTIEENSSTYMYFAIYNLYFLNFYWFSKMIKIIFKNVINYWLLLGLRRLLGL